jgi:hypothetical protein
MRTQLAAAGTRCLPIVFALAGLFMPMVASEAAAQSDAGTASATVTVNASAISVVGIADLDFGSHFATDGSVANETPALWSVDPGGTAVDVDLAMTQLPTLLDNGSGDQVPLTYGSTSLWAGCGTGPVRSDPAVGIVQCDLNPPGGGGNVALGLDDGGAGDLVEVDLTGAAGGTYTATLELTATIH